MTRPKLADVARLAGVGIGTASDALAGKNRIPEDTRRRVRQAADALGYVPNPVARALSGGSLPVIGIVLTALRHPDEFEPYRAYWGELIGSASIAAVEAGYAVTVVPGTAEVMSNALPVSGLVVVTAREEDDDVERALRLGIPVVADGWTRDPRCAGWVDLDYAGAATTVMDHFVAQGASRPALLWGLAGDQFLSRVEQAHREWCAATGHDVVAASTDPRNERLEAAVGELLDEGADAIFTVVESVARITRVLEARGLRVGQDVLLATLDEDLGGHLAGSGITTVDLTGGRYGETVVKALLSVLDRSASGQVEVKGNVTLHPRASTRA